jgi:hypothetical protein
MGQRVYIALEAHIDDTKRSHALHGIFLHFVFHPFLIFLPSEPLSHSFLHSHMESLSIEEGSHEVSQPGSQPGVHSVSY